MSAALDGLRVIEVTHGMAGAMAGMVLAENGADVVLVEPPWGAERRGTPGFHVWNRGKKSTVMDLTIDADRRRLIELVDASDALVSDLRAGTVTRLGLDATSLLARSPALVHVTISGFGPVGPLAGLPGYEWVVAARSGLMSAQRGGRERPIFTPTPILSYGAAQLAVQGLLAAVHARSLSGKGQRVETSLLHALVGYAMSTGPGRRHGDPSRAAVSGVVPLAFMTALCADGRYIQMCSRQPHLFRNWMRTIGLHDIADDPELAHAPDVFPSRERLAEVEGAITTRMAERTMDEWLELFLGMDVGGDPFLTAGEFLHSEQAKAIDRLRTVEDSTLGTTRQIGPLARYSETPARIDTGAPRFGEHTGHELRGGLARAAKFLPHDPDANGSPRFPLEGVTVVECAFFYAAPFSMTLFSQLGARVIKVEPPEGDPTRRNWLTDYAKTTAGKESVVADLKTAEGREILYRLLANADVFLHNFRPGVPEKLGIDYETLIALNPRLVYVYGACYGTGGPWSQRPGFHSTPVAVAGAGVLEAGAGNPPVDRAFGDPAGALGAASAAMVGLAARERTGKGQYVEPTMISSMAYALSAWSIEYTGKGPDPDVDGDQLGFSALIRLYPTADGWLLLCCPTEREYSALVGALGSDELAEDSRFDNADRRQANDPALSETLSRILLTKPAAQWESVLLASGVAAVRADDVDHDRFMLDDPHVLANHMALWDEMDGVGRFLRGANCYAFPDMAVNEDGCEPLGASTARVLIEHGYSRAQVDALTAAGVTRAVGHGL
jgi:crotonobetainyl-CoA:carnitine CoA-transferase CaiB-like acyl-CoA transferase